MVTVGNISFGVVGKGVKQKMRIAKNKLHVGDVIHCADQANLAKYREVLHTEGYRLDIALKSFTITIVSTPEG